MAAAFSPAEALDGRLAQLLVARQAPHLILAATPAWLAVSGYAERDIVGRALSLLLQGDGMCMTTVGALWSALQARQSTAPHSRTVRPSAARSHQASPHTTARTRTPTDKFAEEAGRACEAATVCVSWPCVEAG